MDAQQEPHQPVLLEAVLELLQPQTGQSYLDLTAGYGGHARAVIERTKASQQAVLVDRDQTAIDALRALAALKGADIRHQDFATAAHTLIEEGRQFDLILADFGVSSPQLDTAERGFSFSQSAPLDMRMDRQQAVTAAEIVNELPEGELAQLIREYGEEPRAKGIARTIVAARPLATTTELAAVIEQVNRRRGKIHPATRTFQALRIATNRELDQIEALLPLLPLLLRENGRVALISFHSLEDRLIKRFFKEQYEAGYEAELRALNKQAISGADGDVYNPRARSAKLRAGVKIKK